MNEWLIIITGILGSGLRQSAPLILAAMGGLVAERSGTVDIGLEGKMLMSAFFTASVTTMTGSLALGICAGVSVSVVLALLHGFATITHRGDQTISGLSVNILAVGLTVFLGQAYFGLGGQTPSLEAGQRFSPLVLPGAEWLSGVAVLGPLYSRVVSGHHALTYLAIVAVFVTWYMLYRTTFGLHLRAVGDEPNAVDAAGLSVARLRYLAMVWAGVMCGLSGVCISTAQNAGFVRDMSAGMGFMALAAVIYGRWRPVKTLLSCLLFGILAAMSDRMQGVPIFNNWEIPSQFFSALPYALTILLLAGFGGKTEAPKAIGQPFTKER